MSPTKIVHIEDKYAAVRQLIELGRQKRFLLYDEIYEVLPDEVIGLPDEVDEIYLRFDELKIAVVDRPERYVNRDDVEPTLDVPELLASVRALALEARRLRDQLRGVFERQERRPRSIALEHERAVGGDGHVLRIGRNGDLRFDGIAVGGV